MPDQEYSYKYLQTDTDDDTDEETEEEVKQYKSNESEQDKSAETNDEVETDAEHEETTNSCDVALVFPNLHRYWNSFTSISGKVIQKTSSFFMSKAVSNTVDLIYDVFDYSARKFDAMIYTALTYYYLSFCFIASSLFSNGEKAYKDLMYDGSRLIYQIKDNKEVTECDQEDDQTQRCIVLTSRSTFDLYLPFTFLRHLPFRIWDTDSSLNRTFIPRSFIVQTNEEVEEAIEDGYSIVVHTRSFLSDVDSSNLSRVVTKHQLPVETVDAEGISNWFPYSSDYSIYTFPQSYPITLTRNWVRRVFPILPSVTPAPQSVVKKPLLAVLSMLLMYPFQSTFNLVLKYIAIRNLHYNHSCFLNPETILFLALIVYR